MAKAADRIPTAAAMPGGSWYEPKWDGPYPRILDTGCDYAAGCSVAAWPVW